MQGQRQTTEVTGGGYNYNIAAALVLVGRREMGGRVMNERRRRAAGHPAVGTRPGGSVLGKVKANKKTMRFTRLLSLSRLE